MTTTMTEDERIARGIVQRVAELADLVLEARKLLAARRAGGEHVDATTIAGFMIRALRELGGSLSDGNAHRLRHPFEEERPLEDVRGLRAAISLVGKLAGALERRAPDALLDDLALVWPASPNKAKAEDALRELHAGRARVKADADQAAHAKRLAERPKAARVGAPTPIRSLKDPRPEGEWVVGDDFSGDIPELAGVG